MSTLAISMEFRKVRCVVYAGTRLKLTKAPYCIVFLDTSVLTVVNTECSKSCKWRCYGPGDEDCCDKICGTGCTGPGPEDCLVQYCCFSSIY